MHALSRCVQLRGIMCAFVSKMLESSSFNKLLSGARECCRAVKRAANKDRGFDPEVRPAGAERTHAVWLVVSAGLLPSGAGPATRHNSDAAFGSKHLPVFLSP